MKTYSGGIANLLPNQIFVFGSNTQGRHGKGAALWAKNHAGAIYGKPTGLQGQSYGIITKDLRKLTHPSVSRKDIITQIETLYYAAELMPQLEFLIAYSGIGINLNGYTSAEMALMFNEAGSIPDNIVFEENFAKLIKQSNCLF